MDPELKKALDALGMTQAQAIEGQQKAHAAFVEARAEADKKRDVTTDGKIENLQKALDKFEPVSAALLKIEETAKAAADERKAQQEQLDRIETRVNRPVAGQEVPDEKAVALRSAFVDYMRFGMDRLTPERKNVLTIGDDTGGGYLSPSEYVKEIIKAVVEFSPMRTLARVVTTSSKSVQWPKRTGTYTGGWVGETEARTEATGQAYGLEDIPANEQWIEAYVSMSLLEDSVFDVESEVKMDAAEQFGVLEGAAFVSGAGTKRPEGFLTAAGTNAINSLAATDVTADGIFDLKYSLKTAYAREASFVLNRKTLRNVRKLKGGDGNYLWMPGLAQGRPNSIDGDPYAEFPDMADPAASAKIMAFGAWRRAYVIIDRLALQVVRDGLTRASSGQVKFIMRRRVGGQCVLPEAISVMSCSASVNA
jgi:HK97 family phage major capsid protein